MLESHELITVLGAFLLVLIGVELLDTIKAYFIENTIHVEIEDPCHHSRIKMIIPIAAATAITVTGLI